MLASDLDFQQEATLSSMNWACLDLEISQSPPYFCQLDALLHQEDFERLHAKLWVRNLIAEMNVYDEIDSAEDSDSDPWGSESESDSE